MAFAITSDGQGFILHGELDMANEQELAAAFDAVLGSGAPVTVDMRQLQFYGLQWDQGDHCCGQGRPGRVHHPARRTRLGTEGRAHDADRGGSQPECDALRLGV